MNRDLDIFSQFPDTSRIWIYGFKEQLSEEDLTIVNSHLRFFTETWKSHSRDIEADFRIIKNCFLVFAISERDTISGCSIDSSVKILKNLRDSFGLDALDQNLIFLQQNGRIESAARQEFMDLVNKNLIEKNTLIYGFSIQNLEGLRRKAFTKHFKESWVATAFYSFI